LANVLWRASRFGEARGVLQEALELVDRQHPLQAARLQARLGRVEVEDSVSALSTSTRATICYRAAVAAFDAADELLGDPAELDQEASDVWLEVQVDGRANLHYWWNEPELGAMALTRARWVVEARGSPQRKAGFYAHLAGQQARRNRHRIDEEILAKRSGCGDGSRPRRRRARGGLERVQPGLPFALARGPGRSARKTGGVACHRRADR